MPGITRYLELPASHLGVGRKVHVHFHLPSLESLVVCGELTSGKAGNDHIDHITSGPCKPAKRDQVRASTLLWRSLSLRTLRMPSGPHPVEQPSPIGPQLHCPSTSKSLRAPATVLGTGLYSLRQFSHFIICASSLSVHCLSWLSSDLLLIYV